MGIFRCYTEKRAGFDERARGLMPELRFFGVTGVASVRVFSRYDIEGIAPQSYPAVKARVLSEPQTDICYDEQLPAFEGKRWILGIQALPGQYDQRADSCAQCIQLITMGERPIVASATVYVFFGDLTPEDKKRITGLLINPVENREAEPEKPETLARTYREPEPAVTLDGFTTLGGAELSDLRTEYSLAMDAADLQFMQDYFRDSERRDPTVTELRLIDTYWSDHCRHTTFLTQIDGADIRNPEVLAAYARYLDTRREVYGDEERPVTLMDIATIGAKALRKRGQLPNLDVSEEVNACSVHVTADVDGRSEDWLLMFKNETHNHPTEIEPFGGAATCIGGAIRDPLSGRAYVYQAMRVTGSGDPRAPVSAAIPGKLPQKKLTVTAAEGYSSYGNQIGLATGLVHELYHPGYVAKRMEIGAVVGAARAANVRRERPEPGDAVILLGGRTGRDGIGGATGSSKSHNETSLETMACEVQKGNAPEERKLQRLFLDPQVTRMIRRCNDFGAGGVSVAIGELADGLDIDLNLVRKKYEGLDGTELAISESQERMAVVVAPGDAGAFIEKAAGENLEAYVVAHVTAQPRLVMRYKDAVIADLSREFLSSNGAKRRASVKVLDDEPRAADHGRGGDFIAGVRAMASDISFASQRGLSERFDGSVGAGSVLWPLGGASQRTPAQVMAALLPVMDGETATCSVMSFGFDPYASKRSPYAAARDAVVTSVAKLVASGCDARSAYLTFQEYFERLGGDPVRWGKPFSALLGALDAQLGLGIAAIGGKDSMSGTFKDIDVPPTLVSFAVAVSGARTVISPEFKAAGQEVALFTADGFGELLSIWDEIRRGVEDGAIVSAWAVTAGGVPEAVFKMALGNGIGVRLEDNAPLYPKAGAILAELTRPVPRAVIIGRTIASPEIRADGKAASLEELARAWEAPLEGVFPTRTGASGPVSAISFTDRPGYAAVQRFSRPRALIAAFPGTNSELDTARAVTRAGGEAKIIVVRNLTPAWLEASIEGMLMELSRSQLLILPGGFSGGDEPDGSAKFITAFFRSPRLTDALHRLLYERDGLILGICNGFQALIKLGLVPFGQVRDMDATCPTLARNEIGRHVSRYVYTRVASVKSPWMSKMNLGDIHAVPVSHGEGRFYLPGGDLTDLAQAGQIATQYTDACGSPSMDIEVNPNGSQYAIEGLFSPDGRVFGKMAHSERRGELVAKNIYGDKHEPVFESGVAYYKI